MAKPKQTVKLTARLLADLAAASPEGFFHRSALQRYPVDGELVALITETQTAGSIGVEGDYLYDAKRLTAEQVRERCQLFEGTFPSLRPDGLPASRSIEQRMRERVRQLDRHNDAAFKRLVNSFEGTMGYATRHDFCTESGDEGALSMLLDMGLLKVSGNYVFDPLRITRPALREVIHKQVLEPVREQLIAHLETLPGHAAAHVDLVERFGAGILDEVLELGDFAVFWVKSPRGDVTWVRLSKADAAIAHQIAFESVQPKDDDWLAIYPLCGDHLRHDAQDGPKPRDKVLARSYTIQQAHKQLDLKKETVLSAIASRLLHAFIDPEGMHRLSAEQLHAVQMDRERMERISGLEELGLREVAVVLGEPLRSVEQRLRKAKIGSYWEKPRWRNLAGQFGLPDTLLEFRKLYHERRKEWVEAREAEKARREAQRDEERRTEREKRAEQRRQRETLRAKLLAAFPTWQHEGRVDQHMILHVGPPNSGKTHQALDALSIAENGWYLAPLRLLAFEIFDRLNQRGIPCSLLTGEEYIPVPGARVTASTIEMFNPTNSGDCVIIDEAQMLADPDRGWAWTRALMEAQAPDIHVIGPHNARDLIERLATAAGIPVDLAEHERLAPIQIAEQPWLLQDLPPRTILVAFSRRLVLQLKTELENYKRTVSVVYGNLPPEVRRRQADRFAAGQTEICVATDAVGMGLNLPADNVCFFEMEKFDGQQVRQLTPAEVHQIGGRAGRFGLSQAGIIGATNKRNLRLLRQLYNTLPTVLTHARVAPAVEDLAMIPGSLSHRLAQWRELQSIPDALRSVLRPADIDERIALARMLTDQEVDQLGLESAIKLINAPTRDISREYWRLCSSAILSGRPMPLPPDAPFTIENNYHLDETERSISCADVYLWLARREEFGLHAPDEQRVRDIRMEWSMAIDAALLRRLDTRARCVNCHKPLPIGHRYTLCDQCYHQRANYWY